MCYTYIRRKRGKRKLWTTDFYGRQRRKRRRKRRTTLLEDIIIGILLFLCVRRKVKRERERERERERKAQKQKAAKTQQTKKKKKERTLSVIFDVKAFFSILISREESQLQSSQKHTTKQENKSSSNLTYK